MIIICIISFLFKTKGLYLERSLTQVLTDFPRYLSETSHSPLLEKVCEPCVCISAGVKFREPHSCIFRKPNSSPIHSTGHLLAEAVEVIVRERLGKTSKLLNYLNYGPFAISRPNCLCCFAISCATDLSSLVRA